METSASENLEPPPNLDAGSACTDLIAFPERWINRRVETVELLSHEETRRRASIDFTLADDALERLHIDGEGVVVPISALTKEPRRNFDLRDESGRAVPVLGKEQNGELALIALLNRALDVLPSDLTKEVFEMLAADLRQVVFGAPDLANDALAFFVGSATGGDRWRSSIWHDQACQRILTTLVDNYVLFAVLQAGGPNRRVLKYSYGDDFNTVAESQSLRERLSPRSIARKAWRPDRRAFVVQSPGAGRAASFHAEIAIPEELRIDWAVLWDFDTNQAASKPEFNVNRASLYAGGDLTPESDVNAAIQVAPERGGRTFQSFVTALLVAALLWLGVASGLDAKNPSAAISILLAGAALFSGFAAAQGEHRLIKQVFSSSRRWLSLVSVSALGASASLAMEIPTEHPVSAWRLAAAVSTVAAVRLGWSAIRAPA